MLLPHTRASSLERLWPSPRFWFSAKPQGALIAAAAGPGSLETPFVRRESGLPWAFQDRLFPSTGAGKASYTLGNKTSHF
jgi:hypothetical protein